jgi:zinc ribbon protein
MMTSSRKLLVLCLVVMLALGAALPAQAQQAVTIETMSVKVWPEYDRAGVLVFYIGHTTATGQTDLTFNLPSGAELNAAAYFDEQGSLSNAENTIKGSQVTITSPNGTFHIEFYDTSLASDGDKRSYGLAFKSEYDINAFNWEIQQPAAATGFTLDPPLAEQVTDEIGLPAFRSAPQAVKAGDSLNITLAYTRAGGGLTTDRLQPAQPQTTPGTTTAPGSADNTLTIVLAITGVVVIAGVVIYYFRREGGFGVRVVGDDGGRKPRTADKSPVFCPRCGTPSRGNDKFCRKCGAKLG